MQGLDRPLARDEESFRALHEQREPLYREVADATAEDVDDVVLAAAGVHVGVGSLELLGDLLPGNGPVALVADAHVAGIHGADAQLALGARLASVHEATAKSSAELEALWHALKLDRSGNLVALGGGTTTDLAGFAAATYLRGIDWVAVPTTLLGQVDAAIGGKTGIDTADGKNLAGAFHFPRLVALEASYLATLPESERRAGMSEVVKTGLLAGTELWALAEAEMVRACAAFKAGIVLSDPFEREGRRTILNLGHTFAHALETGSGYTVSHGDAVALGLLAALRISGLPTDAVEEVLRPQPVAADLDAAWAALKRDKKGEGVFVLLEAPGRPAVTSVDDATARKALEALIRK